MPFLELHLRLKSAQQPVLEAALEASGSMALTLLDAEDAPILEPGPGETPLWPDLFMSALYPIEVDRIELLIKLEALLADKMQPGSLCPIAMVLRSARFAEVDDRDWIRVWMDSYQPMRFGERLWIVPTTAQPPDPAAINLRLDPGLAFGTGTHPTTALCLTWLDGLTLENKRVLDFGCGSGILSVAALLLGASHAWAIDNDPQALIATHENAARNQVGAKLSVLSDRDPHPAPVEVLVANILLPPLLALAPQMASLCLPGAQAAFSGMLAGQEREFISRYESAFEGFQTVQQGDWIRISAQRKR